MCKIQCVTPAFNDGVILPPPPPPSHPPTHSALTQPQIFGCGFALSQVAVPTANYAVFTTRMQENAVNTKVSGTLRNEELQMRETPTAPMRKCFECRKRCENRCNRHVGFARLRHVGANNNTSNINNHTHNTNDNDNINDNNSHKQ